VEKRTAAHLDALFADPTVGGERVREHIGGHSGIGDILSSWNHGKEITHGRSDVRRGE
jgi:hypothetical protein